jgi:ABC-type amino acid transport substrate-binding protein
MTTRREFVKLALAAAPAAGLITAARPLIAADAAKPNSRFGGVHIGINAPYSFGNAAMSAGDILKTCVELNLSAIELRTQPIEAAFGAPANLTSAKTKALPAGAAEDHAKQLRAWRERVDMAKGRAFRKHWEDTGVFIEVIKVDGIFRMGEGELDYVFTLAKALGARGISTEIGKDDDHKRVGKFADKHKIHLSLHGHASTGPANWETAFEHGEHVGANVDLGHFVAGDHGSPVPFITKHHKRITHVHIKDRKKGNGPNTPFGEGDTPIVEVLRLIRDNKWPIQATIEFEYRVPAGSDRTAEIAKCVKFCRDALV